MQCISITVKERNGKLKNYAHKVIIFRRFAIGLIQIPANAAEARDHAR